MYCKKSGKFNLRMTIELKKKKIKLFYITTSNRFTEYFQLTSFVYCNPIPIKSI